jgi:cell division protein FtsW (lipid II flippase)
MLYIAISIVVLAIITAVVIYSGKSRMRYMGQETKKENKLMFWIGIVVVAIAVIFFLTAKEEMEEKMWAIPIWIMGIGLIAGSQYRLIK